MRPANLPPEFDRGTVTTVHQGDCLVSSSANLTFSTVLGSCISACIRDVQAGVGGMNHFLLAEPSANSRDRYGASARYGAFAMEQLINRVLSLGTGRKQNLEIKLFGGGLINRALTDIGAKNIAFAREFLENEGYQLSKEDLGGTYARRVMFKPHSGRAFIKRLDNAAGATVAQEELAVVSRGPIVPAASSDIELF